MKQNVVFIGNESWSANFDGLPFDFFIHEVGCEKENGHILPHIIEINPDLCVLDIRIKGSNGYDLCKQIKNQFPLLPLIFLTDDHEGDKILRGFHSGGTCFLTKPYEPESLLERITFNLRPKSGNSLLNAGFRDEIKIGKCIFSPDMCRLLTPTETVSLSLREMQVLLVLADHLHCLVDRKILLMEIWGDDSYLNSRNLDVYIRRLRQLLNASTDLEIHTIKGKGYLLLAGNP